MIGWLIRILLFVGGMIAGIFVSEDRVNHQILGLMIAILLLAIILATVAFWPAIVVFFKRLFTGKS